MKPSPFTPNAFPKLPRIKGFQMAVAQAGIKYAGRTDVWVLIGQAGTEIAGVFTKNKCPGAPVDWSRLALNVKQDKTVPRLILVNSGTANVFAGQKGRDAVSQSATALAHEFGGSPEAVFISSTGVIGVPLDASKVTAKFPQMKSELTEDGWADAAQAIMTTDTYPKGAHARAVIDGVDISINGIAKGSGMIAPDMATMLGYIATDAAISQKALQDILIELANRSFNAITVDSDTSTSDTVLLAASGQAGHARIEEAHDPRLKDFKRALGALMLDLAHQIVKDGEGASKFVEIEVTHAVSDLSAKNIAMSVANSPLVKTAIAGEDANWGRLIMAVGKAGEPAERDLLSIRLGDILLARRGAPNEDYTEEEGAHYMKNSELKISIDMGLGEGCATVWTCDFTHAYIDINADYRS